MANNEKGLIVGPGGEPASIPVRSLDTEDAEILRKYKKFLARHGLREALFCNNCWDGNVHDGCEAFVTDNEIVIRCRCALRVYRGLTF
jgi:hypothetical protein